MAVVLTFSPRKSAADTANDNPKLEGGPEDPGDPPDACVTAKALKASLARPARSPRVQLRIPLDDPGHAAVAVTLLSHAAAQAEQILRSSARQRRPGLICPMAAVRELLERCNKQINAYQRPSEKTAASKG